ncbi:MAG TPA: STAS domain-containing protein [Candidatus Saccharimonadales bacterium]|nr:STAS domain-containing protein [Candidatus Saccharimonadales bacterium]
MILLLNKTTPKEGVTVLHMKGSIHSGPDCRRVEQEVEHVISAKSSLVILDLTEVTHIDSSAIGSIVRCFTRVKHSGGKLCLAGCVGMIEASIRLTRLDKVLEMFPTAAVAAEKCSSAN